MLLQEDLPFALCLENAFIYKLNYVGLDSLPNSYLHSIALYHIWRLKE